MNYIRAGRLALLSACLGTSIFLFTMAPAYSATQEYTYYWDSDQDGWGIRLDVFGQPAKVTDSPTAPVMDYPWTRYALIFGDQDDTRSVFHPGAEEFFGLPFDFNGDMLPGSPLGPLAPQFNGTFNGYTVMAGSALQFTLSAFDPDDNNLAPSIQMQANPSGATIASLSNGQAEFSWLASAEDIGKTFHLRFFAIDSSGYGQLDTTVTVTAAVPEPETYTMMLAGLGLLGFSARRRKQQVAA